MLHTTGYVTYLTFSLLCFALQVSVTNLTSSLSCFSQARVRAVCTGGVVEDSILLRYVALSNGLKERGAFIVKVLEFGTFFFFRMHYFRFETSDARGVSFLNEWAKNNKSASVPTRFRSLPRALFVRLESDGFLKL